jgi:hypothetical protein
MVNRINSVRYSPIRRSAWVPMLVMVGIALALLVVFTIIGVIVLAVF